MKAIALEVLKFELADTKVQEHDLGNWFYRENKCEDVEYYKVKKQELAEKIEKLQNAIDKIEAEW